MNEQLYNGPIKRVKLTSETKIIVDLPFFLFVYLADESDAITIESVECFERLLQKRDWCRSKLLKKALQNTEKRRDLLWTAYVNRELTPSLKSLQSLIVGVFGGLDAAARDEIADDYLFFMREIARVARATRTSQEADWDREGDYAELALQLLRPEMSQAGAQSRKVGSGPDIDFRKLVKTSPRAEADDADKPTSLKCVQVIDETHDVKTFCFLTNPATYLNYLPGQFGTIGVTISGKVVYRSYTISSAPSRPVVISITVKRVEGGMVSNWLHDNLSAGDQIAFKGVGGHFTCAEDATDRLLLISGGSGITPVMSMLRWLHDWGDERPVTFIHCARTEDDIIFYDEIMEIAQAAPNVQAAYLCSQPNGRSSRPNRPGRISIEAIADICPDYHERAVYVCGPAPFMESTKACLENDGFAMEQYHEESFGGAPKKAKKAAPASPSAAGDAVAVHFVDGDQTVSGSRDETILDLAEGAGIEIPSACRAGACGACKIKLIKGNVDQDCTDALTDADQSGGYILSCQARPQSDVEVSIS